MNPLLALILTLTEPPATEAERNFVHLVKEATSSDDFLAQLAPFSRLEITSQEQLEMDKALIPSLVTVFITSLGDEAFSAFNDLFTEVFVVVIPDPCPIFEELEYAILFETRLGDGSYAAVIRRPDSTFSD